MRRAYDEQAQRLEEQRKEIRERIALEYPLDDQNPVQHASNFQRAYPTSVVAFNEALPSNHAPLHEPLPSTSVPNPSTVVQNLLPQDGTSSNSTTVTSPQPSVVMNLAAIQPQTAIAAQPQTTVAGVAVNLSTTVNSTTAVSTAISAAQPYIPPWRRPHANPHPMQDHNLNAGGLRQEGVMRAATVASVATIGNSLQPPSAYVATNAQLGNQPNQAVGAQRNLSHRYSTEWETQIVQELSADEEDLRRI